MDFWTLKNLLVGRSSKLISGKTKGECFWFYAVSKIASNEAYLALGMGNKSAHRPS